MTSRPLLPSVIAALLLLLTANVFMAVWRQRLPYYRKLEYIREAQDANLFFIGNSLLDGRVDALEIEQAGAQRGVRLAPLNGALGATQPPEHLLLFDYSTRCHPGMRMLVLGVFDFQLSGLDLARPADLIGNRVLGVDSRFTFSEVVSVYRFGPLQQAEFEGMRVFPMIAYRTNAWKDTELLRRKMETMGMPQERSNGMGKVNDFNELEAGSVESFDAQAGTFLAHPAFNASYETMFGKARRAGMKAVIVVMPMSPAHRQRYYARPAWLEYLQGVRILAKDGGIEVIDASGWMPAESDFVDRVHMSESAVHKFSARIGAILSEEF